MLNRYEYTGRTEEESLGHGWRDSFHPDEEAETEERWWHSRDTGAPFSTENRCKNKDGEYRWMLVRALPLKNMQTGVIERWFGTSTDIHEMVETRSAAKRLVSTPSLRMTFPLTSSAPTTSICDNSRPSNHLLGGQESKSHAP